MSAKFQPQVGISHRDFDGLAAGVLIKKTFGIDVEYVMYPRLDDALKRATDSNLFVIMTDISPSRKQYERHVHDFKQETILVIDHHEATKREGLVGKPGIVWDDRHAGSDLTLKWLLQTWPDRYDRFKEYADLAILAADYDLWKHEDPMSALWNELIGHIGFDRAERRFLKDPSVTLTHSERLLAKDLLVQRVKTREWVHDTMQVTTHANGSHKLGVLLFEQKPFVFLEVSEYMNSTDVDMVCIIYDTRRCSMRSKSLNILDSDFGDLFKGHAIAAGLQSDKFTTNDVLDIISENYE